MGVLFRQLSLAVFILALVAVCATLGAAIAAKRAPGQRASNRPRKPSIQVIYRSTDADGVRTYDVASPENGGAQEIRVLAPTHPAPDVPHNFLIALPVEAGLNKDYGDGMETLRLLDAQDRHNLTIVEPTFGIEPWYADNPENPSVRYETFLTADLVPWVRHHLALTGREETWLIGFSKSGIGATDLILKHPKLFTLAAAWDFPADMSADDQYYRSSDSYGTDANFQAHYRLTAEFLNAHKASFLTSNRIWIGGYQSFGPDLAHFDKLLSSIKILHTTEPSTPMPHRWDSGWVPIALQALQNDSANLSPALR